MNKKIFIVIFSVFLFVTLSQTVLAVSWLPLVPCGTSANPTPCNQCDLLKLFKNIIDFVLIGLMPPAAAILFVWGGFLILMGGANPGMISQGKSIFWNTAIGVVIISSSWMITNTIVRSLAADNVAPEWWKFECRVTTATGGGPPPVQPPVQPPPGGGTCSFTGVNLCQPRSMQCSASSCSTYIGSVNEYATRTGVANGANLLKAIMVKESSCNALADSGHAYGLMQFVPSTANIYKSRCGIQSQITSQWLKNNPSLSICIAAEYIRAISQSACGSSVRNIAAGYNGGESTAGACGLSVSCAGDKSCDGSAIKRWECLFDTPQRNTCNTGYNETRDYATKVLYCYNNPGF